MTKPAAFWTTLVHAIIIKFLLFSFCPVSKGGKRSFKGTVQRDLEGVKSGISC
jgi:hypothetical protein